MYFCVFIHCIVLIFTASWQHQSNLSDNDRTNLQALLGAIIEKLKYDESYNFSNEVVYTCYVIVLIILASMCNW